MTPRRAAWSRDPRGLTLLEVVLALAIMAAIVVILAGSVRVGLRAWEAGARETAIQQEVRAIVELVTEALSAAHPYRSRLGNNPQRVVLFEGDADHVRFVTTAQPLALDAPAAPFHAVMLGRTEAGELRVMERLVPTEEPFGEGPQVILSRSIAEFRLQYLDDKGLWLDRWDRETASAFFALPAAVRIELTVRHQDRSERVPAFVVPIHLGKRAA